MSDQQSYEVCLGDWESVLPKICEVIGATYVPGEFTRFEEDCEFDAMDLAHWNVSGNSGCKVIIRIEKYEGYFFGTLTGVGEPYRFAANLLWAAYIASGGNPAAQVKP